MTPWDRHQAEFEDVCESEPYHRRRECPGCGATTKTISGYCMACQPSLLDEPVPTLQPGDPRQLGPHEDWPAWLL